MTDPAETRVELFTIALLMAVLAVFLFGNIANSLAMLAAGLVLLGSGVYQTTRGWHVSLITWILGIVFSLSGLGLRLYLVGTMNIDFVALTLIGLAVYVFLRAIRS
ncbi:MAG: hypothetical protein ACOYL5_08085 [Phototrophicaceae bacterium]|jgi:hypothetical protein